MKFSNETCKDCFCLLTSQWPWPFKRDKMSCLSYWLLRCCSFRDIGWPFFIFGLGMNLIFSFKIWPEGNENLFFRLVGAGRCPRRHTPPAADLGRLHGTCLAGGPESANSTRDTLATSVCAAAIHRDCVLLEPGSDHCNHIIAHRQVYFKQKCP